MLVEELETERKESAIEKMARLITEGRVGEFVKLFSTLRLKRVATSMFIHVTKSGILKDQIPQIMFRDEEYLVVASHIGFKPGGSPFVAIWILGEEDGMLWIHRIWERKTWILDKDGASRDITLYLNQSEPRKPMIIGIPTDLTKEGIKRMMGYDYDYRDNPVFELGKTVRIQGDLVGVKLADITDEDIKKETEKRIENDQYYTKANYESFVRSSLREKVLKENPVLREEIEDQGRYARIFRNGRYARDTEELAIYHDDFPPENFYKTGVEVELERMINYEIRENNAMKWPEFYDEFQRELTEAQGKALSRVAYLLSDENNKQTTLRLTNHIIIIEKALHVNFFSSRGDVEIINKTTAFLIHDEHGVTKIDLDVGRYMFRLLPRHQLG
jgi:hypothetical protein